MYLAENFLSGIVTETRQLLVWSIELLTFELVHFLLLKVENAIRGSVVDLPDEVELEEGEDEEGEEDEEHDGLLGGDRQLGDGDVMALRTGKRRLGLQL